MKPYSIEARAIKHYGLTDYIPYAGYLLENGDMLDFSEGGYLGQRVQDHRNIEGFFKTARRGKALIKFMNRGNVRINANESMYGFEYIKPLSRKQQAVIRKAWLYCRRNAIMFYLEHDDVNGNPISTLTEDDWLDF